MNSLPEDTEASDRSEIEASLEEKKAVLFLLRSDLEDKELLVGSYPAFDYNRFSRKIFYIVRFFFRRLRPRKAPPSFENSPDTSSLKADLATWERAILRTSSRSHKLESLILDRPIFCPEAFWIRWRRFWIQHKIGVPKLALTFAKKKKWRLGILHQYAPQKMVPENFAPTRFPFEKFPSISLVTPSYNQAAFIERTLLSVLDQGYPKIEYFVQDGNSSDETTTVLRRYEDRLAGWESAKDKGQSDAIIKAFKKTTGEIMAWLNSDDTLMPGALHHIGAYFAQHPEVDVVYGHRVIIDEYDREVGRWFLPAHKPESLRWADFVPQETLFWRRKAWDKVGGLDPKFQFALDWDLLLRFQNEGLVIRRLPYFLGCFRVHESQKTSAVIHTTGQKEMDLLRHREHGRNICQAVVDVHVQSILVESTFCSTLWKLGIRR